MIRTASQIDKEFRLENGCCEEACDNGWIPATKTERGDWMVDTRDAEHRWKKKLRSPFPSEGDPQPA